MKVKMPLMLRGHEKSASRGEADLLKKKMRWF
jgi:hypothetical protein